MKKLPIGISNFKEIIEENYYYIDKTDFISEVINNGAKVILLSRPRRFGKTLNLSMLRYFFENRGDNQELFRGLKIAQTAEFRENIAKDPIIFLSFKDIKSSNPKEAFNKINSLIREEFGRHKESILRIIESANDEDRYNYYDIIQRKATQDIYEKSLELLSSLLYQAHNQQVVILIDEYDTPSHASY